MFYRAAEETSIQIAINRFSGVTGRKNAVGFCWDSPMGHSLPQSENKDGYCAGRQGPAAELALIVLQQRSDLTIITVELAPA